MNDREIGQSVAVNGTYASISAGDFDGEGNDDMFFHSTGGADPLWWGDTRVSFGSAGSKNLVVAATVTPVVGDFDGDGKDDLLAYVPGSGADTAWWGGARSVFGTDPAHGGLAPETTTISTYTYGASGQLLSQTTGGITTTFVWDQSGGSSQLLGQTTPTGTSHVIHGPAGRPIAQIDPGDTVAWLHTDHVGSVIAATDATGAVTSTQTWDPFGNTTGATGTTQPVPAWQGQPTDPATGQVIIGGGCHLPAGFGCGGSYDPGTGTTTTGGQSSQPGLIEQLGPSRPSSGSGSGHTGGSSTGSGSTGFGGWYGQSGTQSIETADHIIAWLDAHRDEIAFIIAVVQTGVCLYAIANPSFGGACAALGGAGLLLSAYDSYRDGSWTDFLIDALLFVIFWRVPQTIFRSNPAFGRLAGRMTDGWIDIVRNARRTPSQLSRQLLIG